MKVYKEVDSLGMLLAQIADLKAKADEIKKSLIDNHGKGAYEGALFRATVSQYDVDRLDLDAVRAKLSHQFLAAHTTTTQVNKVLVKAKTGAMLKVVEEAA
jgi:hypothetical protein